MPYLDVAPGDAVVSAYWQTTIAAALYSGDPADDVKIELEYLKIRLEELIARDRTLAAAAKAGNFIGSGEIPSPVCEDEEAAGAEDGTAADPSTPDASGSVAPDEEVPPPPLPPPGGWGPAADDDIGPADVAGEGKTLEVRLDDFGDNWFVDDGSHARRSKLRRQALCLAHLLTHQPKNPYCSACMRAKMMRRYAKRSRVAPTRVPAKFGDLVNADHLMAQSAESMGLFGERDA